MRGMGACEPSHLANDGDGENIFRGIAEVPFLPDTAGSDESTPRGDPVNCPDGTKVAGCPPPPPAQPSVSRTYTLLQRNGCDWLESSLYPIS